MTTFKQHMNEMANVEARIPLNDALKLSGEIATKAGFKMIMPNKITGDSIFPRNVMIPTGSVRRGKSSIGDIDFVCTGDFDENDAAELEGTEEVWSRGEKQIFFNYHSDDGLWRPINVFILDDPDSFGAFMIHTTGSNTFNIITRKRAKKEGLLVNQYGVFNRETREKLAGQTENAVFKVLGMDWIPPNERA